MVDVLAVLKNWKRRIDLDGTPAQVVWSDEVQELIDAITSDLSVLPAVGRVEVINHFNGTGRDYVFWPCPPRAPAPLDLVVSTALQDDGRTLKIFLGRKDAQISLL